MSNNLFAMKKHRVFNMIFTENICEQIKLHIQKIHKSNGNAILGGVVAITLLAVSAVMLTQGYLSTLKFKSRVQLKSSLTSVEDGLIYAFTDKNLYLASNALKQALQGKISISDVGKLTLFNPYSAAKLENQIEVNRARETCAQNFYQPTADSSPAEFIFCFSTDNPSNSSNVNRSINTFFGVESAFGLMKVTIKNKNDSHLDSIIKKANWGEFKQNPNNFRADFSYQFFWGRENQPAFSKLGNTVRDLR